MHRIAAVFLLAIAIAPPAARATEFVVTKTSDTLDGACDDDCSLREAVVASNSGPGHVITIPAGVYRLTRAPAPTDPEDGTTGSLYVNRPVTINGAGKDETIIDARPSDGADGIDRVLLVAAPGAATITGVTLRGGRVASGSPRNSTGDEHDNEKQANKSDKPVGIGRNLFDGDDPAEEDEGTQCDDEVAGLGPEKSRANTGAIKVDHADTQEPGKQQDQQGDLWAAGFFKVAFGKKENAFRMSSLAFHDYEPQLQVFSRPG